MSTREDKFNNPDKYIPIFEETLIEWEEGYYLYKIKTFSNGFIEHHRKNTKTGDIIIKSINFKLLAFLNQQIENTFQNKIIQK